MRNARYRLFSVLAGATLCLFAVTAYGQNPSTTTNPPAGTAGTTAGTATPDAQATGSSAVTQPNASTAAPQTPTTTGTATDITTGTGVTTTTTTTRSFPGGFWGIVAVALVVLLILFALFRGRDRTVVSETYASSSATTPGNRSVGTGTAVGDRNLSPRTASGTGPNQGGMNEPPPRP